VADELPVPLVVLCSVVLAFLFSLLARWLFLLEPVPKAALAPKPALLPKTASEKISVPLLSHGELLPAIRRTRALFDDERLLQAGALLERVQATIRVSGADSAAAPLLSGGWTERLAARYAEANEKLASLEDDAGSNWKCVFDRDGVRCLTKRPPGGLLMAKCESTLTGVRLEHLLATFRETHLFNTWYPNCTRSDTIHAAGRMERLFRMVQCVSVPLFGQIKYDLLLQAFGVDAMEPADGATHRPCFLMCGRSAKAGEWEGVTGVHVPPPIGFRMEILAIVVICVPDLSAENTCTSTLLITLDESRLRLPHFVLDFLAATVLSRVFTRQAAKAKQIGERMSDAQSSIAPPHEHVQAIEADPPFYSTWLPTRLDELRSRARDGAGASALVAAASRRHVPPKPRNFIEAMLSCFGAPHEQSFG